MVPTPEPETEVIQEPNEENLSAHIFESSPSEKKWVDSIYNSLTIEEKIGQLFMVAAYSNKDSTHVKSLDKLIDEQKQGEKSIEELIPMAFIRNV